jgi:hypothetical protein
MRQLLSYLVFVGVPFAGLLGVLRLGQKLDAPTAVHGAYAVQPMAASGLVCYRYLLTGGDSTIHLTQSGEQLAGTLGPNGDVNLLGTLSGADLSLKGVISPGGTPRHVACPVGDSVRVTARVSRWGQLKRLDAQLWTATTAQGPAVAFMAARPRRYERRRHF